jgi:hypothetical protein
VGAAGLARYLDDLVTRTRAGDAAALSDAYPFGWAIQAQTYLHSELLRSFGQTHDIPELREAGRRVETVAHDWTGLRITAAHGLADPAASAPELERHAAILRRHHEMAIAEIMSAEEIL